MKTLETIGIMLYKSTKQTCYKRSLVFTLLKNGDKREGSNVGYHDKHSRFQVMLFLPLKGVHLLFFFFF